MDFSCKFRKFTSALLTQHIPGREEQVEGLKAINTDSIPKANEKKLHCREEQMLQHNSMYAHTHAHTHTTHRFTLSASLTPTSPHGKKVDTKQLKILPAHMSGESFGSN